MTIHAEGAGAAVRANAKFCIAPAIATETAPARARWSGSQMPRRLDSGNRSDRTAAVSHARAASW